MGMIELRQMHLVDVHYQTVARVPLFPHEAWPEQVAYCGRVFHSYVQTMPADAPPPKEHLYREE